jgi:iduronate 2-sulfatase
MRRILHLLLSLAPFSALAAERPNVLFIAVDDLRPELACNGKPSQVMASTIPIRPDKLNGGAE